MEDFQQKRRLIEQGQLTSWERRGRGAFTVEHVPFHRTLLQTMFRAGWLRARGERNARNAVVRTCAAPLTPSRQRFVVLRSSISLIFTPMACPA